MSGNNHYKAQQFIDAIPGSGGIITTISKRVGCAWHTAKKYITEYSTVARAYRDECEKVTDMAESVVLKSLQAEDVTTAKWYLTVKARDRGYAQQQRMDLTTDVEPIKASRSTIIVDLDGLPSEILRALANDGESPHGAESREPGADPGGHQYLYPIGDEG
ncbi:MAG: hypothetical protein ABIG68_11645 [Acidobacteriota bacterium]